jgi:hypothetical protein
VTCHKSIRRTANSLSTSRIQSNSLFSNSLFSDSLSCSSSSSCCRSGIRNSYQTIQRLRFTTATPTPTALSLTSNNDSNSHDNNNSKRSSNNVNFINGSDKSDNNSDSLNQNQGRTGWTHSTPQPESKFWKPSAETKQENQDSPQRQQQQQRRIQTGWLHNTKSRVTLEREKQQQQKTSSASATTSPARRLLEQAMIQQERNHRILTVPTLHATGGSAGDTIVAVTQHKISVPLVHYDPTNNSKSNKKNNDGDKPKDNNNRRIDVFFTIVEKVTTTQHRIWLEELQKISNPTARAQYYVEHSNMDTADDMLLYLQGGPGFGAPTPVVGLSVAPSSTGSGSWASAALSNYYTHIVLMDQRGTGRSTPITKQQQ